MCSVSLCYLNVLFFSSHDHVSTVQRVQIFPPFLSECRGWNDKKEKEERDGDCFKILPRFSTYCRHELIKPSQVEIGDPKGGRR